MSAVLRKSLPGRSVAEFDNPLAREQPFESQPRLVVEIEGRRRLAAEAAEERKAKVMVIDSDLGGSTNFNKIQAAYAH